MIYHDLIDVDWYFIKLIWAAARQFWFGQVIEIKIEFRDGILSGQVFGLEKGSWLDKILSRRVGLVLSAIIGSLTSCEYLSVMSRLVRVKNT